MYFFSNKTNVLNIVIITLFYIVSHGQEMKIYNDSLRRISYNDLLTKYHKSKPDTVLSKKYLEAYLQKSKLDKDLTKVAEGYHYLAYANRSNERLEQMYYDSIISVSKNINHKKYPSYAYIAKGNYFYFKKEFDNAMENYLLALEYSKKSKNRNLQITSQNCIGNLKYRIGKYEESKKMFYECHKFYEQLKDKSRQNLDNYLTNLLILATNYSKTNQIDSAVIMNTIGYKESLIKKDTIMVSLFSLNQGIMRYELSNYQACIDSLKNNTNQLSFSNDKSNLAIAYSFLGKSYQALHKIDSAMYYYKKADTVVQKNPLIFFPEIRDNYSLLYELSKRNESKDNQLQYLEKLMEIDSVLATDYRFLNETILKKYDRPKLIEQKENLIAELRESNYSANYRSFIFLFLMITTTIFLIYYVRKQKYYRNKFNELMESQKSLINRDSISSNGSKKLKREIDLPEEVVSEIIKGLDAFIQNKEYLNSKITLQTLASKLNTNAKYLSLVINHIKMKNFSSFISELRINHAIEELKNDKKIRNYTIRAIALQMGFNNAQSFSQAFLKETGIYPSYFLRKIEKKESSFENTTN